MVERQKRVERILKTRTKGRGEEGKSQNKVEQKDEAGRSKRETEEMSK